MIKYRYKTWWWGRYVYKKNNNWYDENNKLYSKDQIDLNDSNFEVYNDIKHGIHNDKGVN